MAIEGAEIVSRHVLDDTQLRAGLTRNEQFIRASSSRMEKALRIDTTVAQRSLSAVNSLVLTFGGNTSIMALQAGRATVALFKLAGAFTATSIAAGAATTAVAVTGTTIAAAVGGIVVLGAAAGVAAGLVIGHFDEIISAADRLRDRVGRSIADALFPSDKLSAAEQKTLARIRKQADAANKIAVDLAARREASDVAKRIAFGEIPPEFAEKDPVIRENLELIRRQREAEVINERLAQVEDQIAKETEANRHQKAMERIREGNARVDRIAELRERRAELVADSLDTTGPGFGITTRESSGFRFGTGAVGSVIGEQNETKKTNDLLAKALQKLDMQIAELRKLTSDTVSIEP